MEPPPPEPHAASAQQMNVKTSARRTYNKPPEAERCLLFMPNFARVLLARPLLSRFARQSRPGCMMKWFVKRQLDAFGRRWNYDVSYMHELVDDAGLGVLAPLQALQNIGKYRRDVPRPAYYAAALVAAQDGDCGPCLQLGVQMAKAQGVDPALIRAVLDGNRSAIDADTALAYDLARAVIARDPSCAALSARAVERFGRRGVASLAYGMIAAQSYPTLKYALGHGKACVRIAV